MTFVSVLSDVTSAHVMGPTTTTVKTPMVKSEIKRTASVVRMMAYPETRPVSRV